MTPLERLNQAVRECVLAEKELSDAAEATKVATERKRLADEEKSAAFTDLFREMRERVLAENGGNDR